MRRSHGACLICSDQWRSSASGILQYYGQEILDKSVLYEDEVLYMTPAPGCLTPGYLILSPKRHILSLAEFNRREFDSLNYVCLSVHQLSIRYRLKEFLAFEHGMFNSMRRGAACIDHAHLHLCPTPSPEEVINYLRRWYEEDEINAWPELANINAGNDNAYIALSRIGETPATILTYKVGAAPSQLIRQRLSIQWGVDKQWDWRAFPHQENYLQTINLFGGQL